MRLVVGIDEDGHQYAVNVNTFSKLKAYVLDCVVNKNWHANMSEELLKKVIAHKDSESLLADNPLVDELYTRHIFNGRTSQYKDDAKGYCIGQLEDPVNKHKELIEKIKNCNTEEELLNNDLKNKYSNFDVFQGRDMFTELWDLEV